MSFPPDFLGSRLKAVQEELQALRINVLPEQAANPLQVANFNPQVALTLKTHRPRASKPTGHYIDINDYRVGYYTGANIQYYTEYRSRRMGKDSVSFPLHSCDPLPLMQFGSLRYFFTSAIEGNIPRSGEPYYLTDPSIKQVVAVRAKADNGHWAQVYIGFNPEQCRLTGYKNSNAIYQGHILVIQHKNTQHLENGHYVAPEVHYLNNMVIGCEMSKHLADPKDLNWKSPIFKEKLEALLLSKVPAGVYFNWDIQMLQSQTCYWTKEENKLKGIQYNHTSGKRLLK